MTSRYWAELGWQDFAARDMAATIAVLPVAAIEQHGPHLPVGVDTMIAEGLVARTAAALPDDLPVLFLPVQTIGKSNEHLDFPGTLSLGAETAIRAWCDIGDSVARAGCHKLVILNAHGGNVPVVDIVGREMRVRHGMLAVICMWPRLGLPPGMISEQETTYGIHGGEVETSLMLAFRPETVRPDKANRFHSRAETIAADNARLRVTQPIGLGWMSQDLNPDGVVGDASAATRDKGERIADHVAAGLVELLHDVHRFDVGSLGPGPLQR